MRHNTFSLRSCGPPACGLPLFRQLFATICWLMILAEYDTARGQGFIDDVFETRSAADGEFVPFDGMTVAGAEFPHVITVDSATLWLAGAGARKESRLVMYSMGYYVGDPNRTAAELIDVDEMSVIRLEAVSPLITPKRFAKAVTRGFEKATGGRPERFDAEIGQFLAALKDRLQRGEVMELIYTPGVGTKILRNGEPLTVVPGLEFKQALFRIWLGDDPIDVALKEDLLGGLD